MIKSLEGGMKCEKRERKQGKLLQIFGSANAKECKFVTYYEPLGIVDPKAVTVDIVGVINSVDISGDIYCIVVWQTGN